MTRFTRLYDNRFTFVVFFKLNGYVRSLWLLIINFFSQLANDGYGVITPEQQPILQPMS